MITMPVGEVKRLKLLTNLVLVRHHLRVYERSQLAFSYMKPHKLTS